MLATAVVVAVAVLVLASLGLFAVGHRLRRGSIAASLALATVGTVTAGEVAARLFRLQSAAVLAAEVGLVLAAAIVAILRRPWNPVGCGSSPPSPSPPPAISPWPPRPPSPAD